MKQNIFRLPLQIIIGLFAIFSLTVAIFSYDKPLLFQICLCVLGACVGAFISIFFQEIPNEILKKSINELLPKNITKIYDKREEVTETNVIKILEYKKELKTITYFHISALDLLTYTNEMKEILEYIDIDIFVVKNDFILKMRFKEISVIDNKFNENIWRNFVKQMNGLNHTLTVYGYDTMPYYSAIVMDYLNNERDLYITQHMYNNNAKNCPTMHLRKHDRLYDIYNDNFTNKLEEIKKDGFLFQSVKGIK